MKKVALLIMMMGSFLLLPHDAAKEEAFQIKQVEQEPEAKTVLGYYTKSEQSIKAFGKYMTQVSTQTFAVTAEGKVVGQAPAEGMKVAGEQGIEAFATITNQQNGDFDKELAHRILNDPTVRQATVENALQAVKVGGYQGVNVDFENMIPGDREEFTVFVQELKAGLKPHGYGVIVSVAAKTVDAPKSNWIGAFDYKALGQAADQVQLMTYDEHGTWGQPGPVASEPWVRNVLKYATSTIPPEKILLGLPAYGADWNMSKGSGHKAVAWKNMPKLLVDTGASPQWDAKSKTPHLTYQAKDGSQHVVWYEDERSIEEKTKLVREFDLAGVAMWRMGLEDERFWQAVRQGLSTPDEGKKTNG